MISINAYTGDTKSCFGIKKRPNEPMSCSAYVIYFYIVSVSPLQYSRTVLVDQRLVIRLQLVDVGQLAGLCVQIKFAVERL